MLEPSATESSGTTVVDVSVDRVVLDEGNFPLADVADGTSRIAVAVDFLSAAEQHSRAMVLERQRFAYDTAFVARFGLDEGSDARRLVDSAVRDDDLDNADVFFTLFAVDGDGAQSPVAMNKLTLAELAGATARHPEETPLFAMDADEGTDEDLTVLARIQVASNWVEVLRAFRGGTRRAAGLRKERWAGWLEKTAVPSPQPYSQSGGP